jgi:hypothetical protein
MSDASMESLTGDQRAKPCWHRAGRPSAATWQMSSHNGPIRGKSLGRGLKPSFSLLDEDAMARTGHPTAQGGAMETG